MSSSSDRSALLVDLGFKVEMPATAVGQKTNIQHFFSLIARKSEESERIIAIDHAVGDAQCCLGFVGDGRDECGDLTLQGASDGFGVEPGVSSVNRSHQNNTSSSIAATAATANGAAKVTCS